MVEVMLTPVRSESPTNSRNNSSDTKRMCWVPFKKQILDNRIKKLTTGPYIENNYRDLKRSSSRNRNSIVGGNSRRGGSLSTGTHGTDVSFLSATDESRTTATMGSSSMKTYNSSSHDTSSSQYGRSRSASNFSYQNNSSIEQSFLNYSNNPTNRRLQSPIKRYPPSNATGIINMSKNDIPHLLNARNDNVELAILETNCMTKEFWTDEVIEKGVLSCVPVKRLDTKPVITEVLPLHDKDDINAKTGSFKARSSVGDNNESTEAKTSAQTTSQQENQQKSDMFYSRVMRYISQDPEKDINDGTPLGRVICSSLPLRDGVKTIFMGNKEKTDAAMSNTNMDYLRCRKSRHDNKADSYCVDGVSSVKLKQPFPKDENSGPNFYVEVEASRYLDEIGAEGHEIMEEEMDIARSASLVDEDSAFISEKIGNSGLKPKDKSTTLLLSQPPSSTRRNNSNLAYKGSMESSSCSTKNGNTSILWSDRYIRDVEEKKSRINDDKGTFGEQHNYDSPNLDSIKNDACKSVYLRRGKEKKERRDKLISEMVTDRVLGMKLENGIISDYKLKEKKTSEISKKNLPRTANEPRAQFEKSLSKHYLSKSNFSTVLDSSSPINTLNISDLTESSSHVPFEVDRNAAMKTNEKATHKSLKRGSRKQKINKRDRVDSRGDPTDRRINLTSHHTDPVTAENFDENFWKEDTDDLNTEAFETYGSEYDSLFGDILSKPDICSKHSTDEPKQSKKTSRKSNHDVKGKLSRAELSKYTRDSSRYSRSHSNGESTARKTYLQSDDFDCA